MCVSVCVSDKHFFSQNIVEFTLESTTPPEVSVRCVPRPIQHHTVALQWFYLLVLCLAVA